MGGGVEGRSFKKDCDSEKTKTLSSDLRVESVSTAEPFRWSAFVSFFDERNFIKLPAQDFTLRCLLGGVRGGVAGLATAGAEAAATAAAAGGDNGGLVEDDVGVTGDAGMSMNLSISMTSEANWTRGLRGGRTVSCWSRFSQDENDGEDGNGSDDDEKDPLTPPPEGCLAAESGGAMFRYGCTRDWRWVWLKFWFRFWFGDDASGFGDEVWVFEEAEGRASPASAKEKSWEMAAERRCWCRR